MNSSTTQAIQLHLKTSEKTRSICLSNRNPPQKHKTQKPLDSQTSRGWVSMRTHKLEKITYECNNQQPDWTNKYWAWGQVITNCLKWQAKVTGLNRIFKEITVIRTYLLLHLGMSLGKIAIWVRTKIATKLKVAQNWKLRLSWRKNYETCTEEINSVKVPLGWSLKACTKLSWNPVRAE